MQPSQTFITRVKKHANSTFVQKKLTREKCIGLSLIGRAVLIHHFYSRQGIEIVNAERSNKDQKRI